MFNLTDRKALVTGASGGIGEQIARQLYECGASVTLTGTRAEKLEKLASELGSRAHVCIANLSNREELNSLVENASSQMDGIDILVNNAGITRDNLVLRMKDEEWDDILEINLSAAFQIARATLRGMIKQRFGRIIGITSVVGVTGNAGQVNYSAAKAGMIGMSKSLAQEVATRNITVNTVAPGMIESPMTDTLNESQKEAIMTNIPMGRLGHGNEVASAVVFLASNEAGYITGQTIHVNGGMAMI